VVTRPVNWGHLHQGVVVWLDAPETLLLARLRADPTPRPLLNDPDPAGRLATLLAARRPLYAQADLHVLQVEATPEAVALQVLEALPSILREQPSAPLRPAMLLDGAGQITQSLN
jgi:shikimate kinase